MYDQRLAALADIQARYQASQQPPAPVDQRDATDIPTPRGAMKIAGLNPDDPWDVQTYNNGYHRLRRLKAQGHYRES